jgi:hypothetical protein
MDKLEFPFRQEGLVEQNGIIVGLDSRLEWLLPFWWYCLKKYNDYPVTFIDYGLTERARRWCQERGETLPLNLEERIFLKRKRNWLNPEQQKRLNTWYTKPFALLQSPYKITLWLDIDCEVRGNLSPLFSLAENPEKMALALGSEKKQEEGILRGIMKPGQQTYNSGVIPFLRGCEIIQTWGYATVHIKGIFPGDQDILSYVINKDEKKVTILPKEYNWRVFRWGINENALILHWDSSTKNNVFNFVKKHPDLSYLIRLDQLLS